MTEFVFGDHHIKVDVEATRTWYAAHGEIAGGCDCAYCRNFAAAVGGAPGEIREFLARLGLDIQRPGEVVECGREENGSHRYTVLYHVAGTLLERGAADIALAPEITGGFASDMGPFLQGFPEPFFQCYLDLHLPWVLEEADI